MSNEIVSVYVAVLKTILLCANKWTLTAHLKYYLQTIWLQILYKQDLILNNLQRSWLYCLILIVLRSVWKNVSIYFSHWMFIYTYMYFFFLSLFLALTKVKDCSLQAIYDKNTFFFFFFFFFCAPKIRLWSLQNFNWAMLLSS